MQIGKAVEPGTGLVQWGMELDAAIQPDTAQDVVKLWKVI